MSQTSYHQRFRSSISSLLVAKTRLELAQTKNQIRMLFQQSIPSNEAPSLVQQLLVFSISSKRVWQLLSWLHQNTDFSTNHSKPLLQIAKKYIEAGNQTSKLDGDQAKNVRVFLAKKLMQQNQQYSTIIQRCRSDQSICSKLLKIVAQFLKEHRPSVDVTGVTVLCLNLTRIHSHIANQLLKNTLFILNYMTCNSQELQNALYPIIINEAVQIFKAERAQKESLQIITNFIKYNLKHQSEKGIVKKHIQAILECLKHKTNVKQILKPEKQFSIEEQYSSQIVSFLEASYSFAANNQEFQKPKNKQKDSEQEECQAELHGHSNIFKQLTNLCRNMLLIINPNCVERIHNILKNCKINKIQKICLSQSLINCIPYNFQWSSANKSQKQIIQQVLVWYNNLKVSEQSQINNKLGLINRIESDKDDFLSFCMDFIKKIIESQFQFEFNKESMSSVCSLLCYLTKILHQKGVNCKETIMDIVKMLLNLNESCEKQYRPFLVKSIVKIICVHAKELLRDNQFLKQTVEMQILKNIFSFKEQVGFLNSNKILTPQFYQKLISMVKTEQQLVDVDRASRQFLFEVLVGNNKQIMQNGLSSSWQWMAYLASAGKKLYGKQLAGLDKQLRSVKENKMVPYSVQFEQDMDMIDSLTGVKKV